ncbi:MAG: capsule assembly Wzi family protein [Saprospiraceae bacterium]|nr:capsule assembly Wzi family protein [Saprospiraceae bacterium]
MNYADIKYILNNYHRTKNVAITLCMVAFFAFNSIAQKATSAENNIAIPLSNSYTNYFEAHLNRLDNTHFTGIRPFIAADVSLLIDSLNREKLYFKDQERGWFPRKIFNEDLLTVGGDDFSFNINPVVNFSFGRDNQWADNTPYINTRGVRVTGNILKKFTFETDILENQALFPKYVTQFILKNEVVPGAGFSKPLDASGFGRDYWNSSGGIAYRPNKYFQFQFGHGRHFFGDGYRSLLLSDNTPNYPYFRVVTSFWKIRYVNLWAQMSDISRIMPDGAFTRKYFNTHFLSWNVSKRLNIGLYEAVVYHDTSGTRGIDLNYLNPFIFYRSIEANLNSAAGNAVLGLNAKFKLTNNQFIYGQFILDEFNSKEFSKKWWGNKYGYQIGIKSFNTLIPNLTVQTEVNMVRPYTYSHYITTQNYGHFNQALAHPLGSNFREWVTNIRYFNKRFFSEARLMLATQGLDSLNRNYGSDVFKDYNTRVSEFGVDLFQGIKTKTLFGDFKIGYLVNPQTNLRLEAGVTVRRISPEKTVGNLKLETTRFFYFGLRTDLYNQYYDF